MTEAQRAFIQAIEEDLAKSFVFERVGFDASDKPTEEDIRSLTERTCQGIAQCLPVGEQRKVLIGRVRLAGEQSLFEVSKTTSGETKPEMSFISSSPGIPQYRVDDITEQDARHRVRQKHIRINVIGGIGFGVSMLIMSFVLKGPPFWYMAFCSVIGGAVFAVMMFNHTFKMLEELSERKCLQCGTARGWAAQTPSTFREWLTVGWICRSCGSKVDYLGKRIS